MIFQFLLLVHSVGFAAEPNCTTLRSYQEFYKCSLLKHPDFEVSKLKMAEAKAIEAQASQLQNPDLEVKELRGKVSGQNTTSTEAVLSFPLSQLWVRGAKKDVGAAEKKLAEIESSESLLDVRKKLILDIYRFRQIQSEIDIFDESIKAFETIRRQLRGRMAKGPEQEVFLSLVEIASSDYEFKKLQLETERSEISSQFIALWGPDFKITKEILPRAKEKWPEISPSLEVAQSFKVQRIQALARRAQAEQNLANKESWPEVKLGPAIEQIDDGTDKFTSYGVNLSLSLPIFSQNQGSRNLTATRAKQAELAANYNVKKAQLEKGFLIQKYKSAVAALRNHSGWEDVKKKHDRVDNLFKQGHVSGGIVIEAHRQITEFTESQHKQELIALETFLDLKALSGEDVEEILQ